MYKKSVLDKFLKFVLVSSTLIVLAVLFTIIGYILISGIPYLSSSLLSFKYTTDNVSAMPAIINTLLIVILTLIIAVPLGVGSAIYLVEYAKKKSRVVGIIRLTTETLSGIPSIVYGLFGMLMFVVYFKLGYSVIAGTLTLVIVILPIIIITTEEALLAIPKTYREASFGLGAGKFYTIRKVVLPSAKSGIIGGVMLSIGRIIGESAALIFTAGTVANIAINGDGSFFTNSGRTLAVHMYLLSGEGLHMNEAKATAVLLLIVVLFINVITFAVTRKGRV